MTRLEVVREGPAFDGVVFGAVGPYELIEAVAYGEVDPGDPANRIIQDLALAPRNARGRVEYAADVMILKPADLARGNGLLLFELPNRGERSARALTFDRGVPSDRDLEEAGDGFLERQGFTLVWGGWQGDLLREDERLGLRVPIARKPDGDSVTGLVRAEFVVQAPTRELPLSAGWFTGGRHAPYPTARVDHRTPFPDGFRPVLTVRAFEADRRVEVPSDQWAFGICPNGDPPVPSEGSICLEPGFEPGRIYELVYRAKDPLVLGLGYAAVRDLVAFLRHEATDDSGRSNPLHRPGRPLVALGHGVSQGARVLRAFLHLGFNRDERGRRVFDGILPHVGSGRAPLNVRFGQPGRAWGDQVDRLYPGYELPLAYAWSADRTGRTSGSLLLRCRATGTCPRVFHVVSAHEYWVGRESLVHTDPAGLVDLPEPPEVRTYLLAGTQHGPASDPADFGDCLYPRNPAPHRETMRALLVALARWVVDGAAPPESRAPRIADGTLVSADQVRFPRIPAVHYGDLVIPGIPAVPAPLGQPRLDFGPLFRPYDLAGILTLEPPRVAEAKAYRILVPQVDADGNDLAGVRSPTIAAPLGTYTGWNLGRAGRWPGRFCTLQGSFVPFARTREERIAVGDPRLSLEERYGDEAGYRSRFHAAIEHLVAERLLLAEDAAWLAGQAPWQRAERPRRSSARTGE